MAQEWFERSFGEDYVLVYQHRDDTAADEEIANLLARLPVKQSGKVLDLCCGSGRHSRALARRGYEVVGVDLSLVLLKLAEEQNHYPNLRFVHCDMRDLPFQEEFDIVVNLFTSFGYFASDKQNAKVVGNMANALKVGGELIIDYLNPAYVKKNLVPRSTKRVKDMVIEERRWIEDEFVNKRIVIRDREDGEPREYLEKVRLFRVEQMIAMLEEAGFGQIEVFGDYRFQPYHDAVSPRMIFYAVRQK